MTGSRRADQRSLHARLDAAKLRVQKDLAASAANGSMPPPRRTRPDRTTRPDRIPPPQRRSPVDRPRLPVRTAATRVATSEPHPPYVAAPVTMETDSPPPPARYKALLLEQDAQSRQRTLLLDRLERELASTDLEDGGVAKHDRDARARALQAELAEQSARRQQLLGALRHMPRGNGPPNPPSEESECSTDQDGPAQLPTPTPSPCAVDLILPSAAISPRRLSAASMPGSDGSDAHSHSDSDSDSETRVVAPKAMQDYQRVAEQTRSLWGELKLAVGSQRDYCSLLTMVRDATNDFW